MNDDAVVDHGIAITHEKSDLLTAAIDVDTALFRVWVPITDGKPAAYNHQSHLSSVNQRWTVIGNSIFYCQRDLRAARPETVTFIEIKRDMVRYCVVPYTFSGGVCAAPLGASTSAMGIY